MNQSIKSNTIIYDENFDILYFHIGDTSNSIGDEDPDNIIKLTDLNTNELTGITILDFKKMAKKRDARLLSIASIMNVEDILRGL